MNPELTNRILAVYLFPNGMIATFGYNQEQIPGLQGKYSADLLVKIKEIADADTQWNGF